MCGCTMQAVLENAKALSLEPLDIVDVLPKRWAEYLRGQDKPPR